MFPLDSSQKGTISLISCDLSLRPLCFSEKWGAGWLAENPWRKVHTLVRNQLRLNGPVCGKTLSLVKPVVAKAARVGRYARSLTTQTTTARRRTSSGTNFVLCWKKTFSPCCRLRASTVSDDVHHVSDSKLATKTKC